jgi:hypothetical protein
MATINGDVVVHAAGNSSDAVLNVNSYNFPDSDANFNGSNVQVEASGQNAWAYGGIYNASGVIDSLSVTASNTNANAYLNLRGNGDLTVSALEATASGSNSNADLDVSISGDLTLDNADITLAATGDGSEVTMSLDANSIAGSVHNLTIRADGANTVSGWTGSLPSLDVTGDILVSAGGYYADASLDLNRYDDLNLGADEHASDVTVQAGGYGAQAEAELFAGRDVPGFKLVEGRRGARAWGDAAEVESEMKKMRIKQDVMYDLKLISPTSAEKAFKDGTIGPRQWPKLQSMITQAQGKPSVAPASDKRPALVLQAAEDEFENLAQPEAFEDLV